MPDFRPDLLPESGQGLVGSVGNLVAAALQTAGFFFQSDILQRGTPLLTGLAVLSFVAAAVWAAYLFVIRASLLRGMPLLLGPVLFFFITRTVVATGPTRLQQGDRVSHTTANEQLQLLRQIGDPAFYGTIPKVSFVFAQLDRIVSTSIQRVVTFLVDTANKEDLLVVAREETLAKLFTTSAIEKDFLELISYGVMGQCAELTNRISERESLQRKLQEQQAWNQPSALETQTKLSQVNQRINALRESRFDIPESISRFVSSRGFSPEPPQNALCDDIYNWSWKGLQQIAEQKLNEATTPEENNSEIPWQRVKEDVQRVLSSARPDMATRVLAAYIFRKTLQERHHENMMSTLIEHSPMRQKDYDIRYRVLPLAEGQGSLMSMLHFIGIVPYVQGLLLFLLAAAFPFFALFLLMPGKMPSFLTWVYLWIWVKSWDIGFALIVGIRKLLWAMIGQKSLPLLKNESLNDLASAFSIMNDFDPLANLGVYYTIIAVLMLSVPIVTAQFCMGAGEMLGAFRSALDQTANRLHQRIATAARRGQASEFEQRLIASQQEMRRREALQWANTDEARALGRSGDPLKTRSMIAHGDAALAHGRYRDEVMDEAADLGYFTRRQVTVSFSGGVSGASLNKWMNNWYAKNTESPDVSQAGTAGIMANQSEKYSTNTAPPNGLIGVK